MNIDEILNDYKYYKLSYSTIFIESKFFIFAYTKIEGVVSKEYSEMYRYFGGLQCKFKVDSIEHNLLEDELCNIAEKILNKKEIKCECPTHYAMEKGILDECITCGVKF